MNFGGVDSDDALDAFMEWVDGQGLSLYPAQEEAILSLFDDQHVIITTPTGSGKSLVATAGHAEALAVGGYSVYTAPIKALVSEKFFDFRQIFGSDNVGMVTGDTQINPDAPIICCTAEILAHAVLQSGRDMPLRHVTADEFHYFSERDRGWAWELPLLELTDTRFLLMSATLGDTAWLVDHLEANTTRTVALVGGGDRPVPLSFRYAITPLHETINELLADGLAPIYIVHFTQKAATEAAQALMSLNVLTKDEKTRVADLIGGFRFDTPFGKDLKRYLMAGIGVHHAGLLPRYRLLVERLAKEGLLKLICGTDTLGVGVNVPIRTVLITQLCKYDGTKTRILGVREFQQIAGRAGRRGYDTAGDVVVQAPPHWIENRREEAKAANAGKKLKHRRKPPEFGYKDWNSDTFDRLVGGQPETLTSRFDIEGGTVLRVLDRDGDGVADLRGIIESSFAKPAAREEMLIRVDDMLGSLVAAELVEELAELDERGRPRRPNPLLQERFSLDRPLSPFVIDMLAVIAEDPDATGNVPAVASGGDDTHGSHAPADASAAVDAVAERSENAPADASTATSPYAVALDMVSVVEASLEDPRVVLVAQQRTLRDVEWQRLTAEGVDFDERKNIVDTIEWPKPLAEQLSAAWAIHLEANPWLAGEWVRPKSIVREMFEEGETFVGYIHRYGLRRSEGVLLRYLADAYRALGRNVPEHLRTPELGEITDWLGGVVRSADASLLDEWERLERIAAGEEVEEATAPDNSATELVDITRNRREFRALVRNDMFRWINSASRRALGSAVGELPQVDEDDRPTQRSAESIDAMLDDYWTEHTWIGIDASARSPRYFVFDEPPSSAGPPTGRHHVTQIIVDPDDTGEWRLEGVVDYDASRMEGAPVVAFAGARRII